jgi:hypothetical protein
MDPLSLPVYRLTDPGLEAIALDISEQWIAAILSLPDPLFWSLDIARTSPF